MFFHKKNTVFGVLLMCATLGLIIACNSEDQLDKTSKKIQYENFISTVNTTADLEQYLDGIDSDSLKKEFIFKTSYKFYQKNDSIKFRYWNQKSKKYSIKNQDTLGIAESYWDLANFLYSQNNRDSAFFNYNKAYNFYNKIRNNYYSGRMLLNMAIIQTDVRDYIGSETNTIRAIELFKPAKKYKQLYKAYNNLGIVSNGLKNYRNAIEYHKLALKYKSELPGLIENAPAYNNIGVVFQNMGNFKLAEEYFQMALSEDSLYFKNPLLYAMVLDNAAYNDLKIGNTNDVESVLNRTLEIRDSLNHISGKVINYLHLGEFYQKYEKDTNKAMISYLKAKNLAESNNNYRDLLRSLLLLVEVNPENEQKYLKKYVSLNDSLISEERSIRNKFARIRFETDQFIEENKQLNYQRNLMIIGFTSALLIISLIFVIRNQRINNKKLILEKQQNQSNEEIFNLLLAQQSKLEEGRGKEKHRISTELHDGILGKLFGIRMSLAGLNEKRDMKSIAIREKNIDELHNLETEIRNISHDLSGSEEKEVDLINLIEEFIEDEKELTGIHFILDIGEKLNWNTINHKIKINFYRIIQESVYNAIKYSKTKKFIITFKIVNENLQLQLRDNGIGFDVKKVRKGIGINNIYSRVADLGGEITLESNKAGTMYTILIPIK